jgi:ParB-like chromosome segregation protein Spo0J
MGVLNEMPDHNMTEMKIEQWPIDRLIPYARNAPEIPQSAIDKVAASIEEFGWRQPIVVDEHDVIIAGHTRLLAARKLGHVTVPLHVARGLTPAQVKMLRLMDNRSHEESSWNLELLRRWQQITGQPATLADDGRTLEQMETVRKQVAESGS